MLILGQKACFLGPTILEMPQPNWHYYSKREEAAWPLLFLNNNDPVFFTFLFSGSQTDPCFQNKNSGCRLTRLLPPNCVTWFYLKQKTSQSLAKKVRETNVVTYFATIWTENSFHKIVLESQQKNLNVRPVPPTVSPLC